MAPPPSCGISAPTSVTRVALHSQQHQLGARGVDRLERDARQPQETRRVLGGGKTLDKGHLHQVEVGLVVMVILFVVVIVRQMRRLPLHRARWLRVIVSGAGAIAVVMMVVIVFPVHDTLPQ